MIVFELTMPNVGSWNNHWSGERDRHILTRREYDVEKSLIEKIVDRDFIYDFGDGWTANIHVSRMPCNESNKLLKKSNGFCGYEWMVRSICKYGKILKPEEMKKKELEKLDRILK